MCSISLRKRERKFGVRAPEATACRRPELLIPHAFKGPTTHQLPRNSTAFYHHGCWYVILARLFNLLKITILLNIDLDGDSTMTSAIDPIRPSDDPHTPTGNVPASFTEINSSELSPPGSNTQAESGAAAQPLRPGDQVPATGKNTEPAVAAWKSKRAQEDYQRAMEFVVDRDFNLRMLL